MGKQANQIVKWGIVKPYFDKFYSFNTIDIETVDNELFLFGYTEKGIYKYTLDNFYKTFHDLIISSMRDKKDILTWSRYDNTHIIKMLLSIFKTKKNIDKALLKVGKISPIFEYNYSYFKFSIENIIKDSILIKITDRNDNKRYVTIYNLKNLFTSDLESTAKSYGLNNYSKLGKEYHIIDRQRFFNDDEYKDMVIKSNRLDNEVLTDIANIFLEDFKNVTGVYPKSIFTAGSIARSYLLAYRKNNEISLQFRQVFNSGKKRDLLLDYSMRAYHGGKIESYVLGYIKQGKIIDITSAYPWALKSLPKLTGKITKGKDIKKLNDYFYAFIHCNIYIENDKLIHPIIFESPINKTNLSPYGYIKDIVITKPEYDYLIKNNCQVDVIDYVACESDDSIYPYENLVNDLFNKRINAKNKGLISLSELFKTILNSLYGITYELTDVYKLDSKGNIVWLGFRAGDYFNSVIASYITSLVRTYLSKVSYNIIVNGGEVYLNMTDSILFNGNVSLDVFSEEKILGKFEPSETIKNIMILGAGRYEYQNDFNNKFTIKSRGFSVSVKDKSFYSSLNLNGIIKIPHKTFITTFKSTTNKYDYKQMGHLIDDTYNINPFNIGGKRIIENINVNLNKEYTRTKPVYLDKYLYG